eukprot:532652_1
MDAANEERMYLLNETENHNVHPLESKSLFIRFMHSVFHVWIFKIIKHGIFSFDDVLDLPYNLQANTAYYKWREIYFQKLNNNKSSSSTAWSTVSMVFAFQKKSIIIALICAIINIFLIIGAYYTFKVALYSAFIQEDFILIIQNSLLIFILFSLKSIIYAWCCSLANHIQTMVGSALYCIIYQHALLLPIEECNKQQLLTIASDDIRSIANVIWYFLNVGALFTLIMPAVAVVFYYVIGLSSVFALIFMIFFGVPLQVFLAYKLSIYTQLRLKITDKRVQLIRELIRGIRVCKCNAYEIPLMDRINEYRINELKYVKKRNLYLSLLILVNFMIPIFMLIITLTIRLFVFNKEITSEIITFSCMILVLTGITVRLIPILLGYIVAGLVSVKRIDVFLNKQTKLQLQQHKQTNSSNKYCIEIKEASFSWSINNTKKHFSLKDICLSIKKGKLIAVVGSVGSGKTSLFQSILGEMECVCGDINININNPSIGYCAQNSYIRNVSLRDNIILDLQYDASKYLKCIIAAQLVHDIKRLPYGDMTIIGEEGVNISGGQKMRVAFARILYRKDIDCDLFLFDDPLSCVDYFVGKHMFYNGIYKHIMNNKNNNNNNTCLMVLNSHLYLLPYFDEIIIMNNGKVAIHTTINELFFNEKNYEIYQKYSHLLPNIEDEKYDIHDIHDNIDMDMDMDMDEKLSNNNNVNISYELTIPQWNLYFEYIKLSICRLDYRKYFLTNEENNSIAIEFKKNDMKKILLVIVVIFILFCIECAFPLCDVWLLLWKNDYFNLSSNICYLSLWISIIIVIGVSNMVTMYFLSILSCMASYNLHSNALYNILRANTLFFDLTPIGEIINMFSSDTNVIDSDIPMYLFQSFLYWSCAIGYILIIIFIMP